MTPKNILVPLDFSACSEQALDYACALGAKLGATIHIVNALGAQLPELNVALTETMIHDLISGHETALQKLADPRRPLVHVGKVLVKSGDARDAILETARELDADLIVMGTHGRRGITRFVVGSVTEDVVRRAPCPVLAVRPKSKGQPS
jgi:nucleotide-binding universal stress UspA family protein